MFHPLLSIQLTRKNLFSPLHTAHNGLGRAGSTLRIRPRAPGAEIPLERVLRRATGERLRFRWEISKRCEAHAAPTHEAIRGSARERQFELGALRQQRRFVRERCAVVHFVVVASRSALREQPREGLGAVVAVLRLEVRLPQALSRHGMATGGLARQPRDPRLQKRGLVHSGSIVAEGRRCPHRLVELDVGEGVRSRQGDGLRHPGHSRR
jgi:hypothetical protein